MASIDALVSGVEWRHVTLVALQELRAPRSAAITDWEMTQQQYQVRSHYNNYPTRLYSNTVHGHTITHAHTHTHTHTGRHAALANRKMQLNKTACRIVTIGKTQQTSLVMLSRVASVIQAATLTLMPWDRLQNMARYNYDQLYCYLEFFESQSVQSIQWVKIALFFVWINLFFYSRIHGLDDHSTIESTVNNGHLYRARWVVTYLSYFCDHVL